MEGKLRAEMEEVEGVGNPLFACPSGCELEPLGMAAPTPFLPAWRGVRSGVRMGGLGAEEYRGRGGSKAPSKPSGPFQTRCCPRNLQVLPPFRAAHSPPSLPRGPQFSTPETTPWLTSGRLQRDSSLVHRTSPDLSDRSCFPRALPFSPVPEPRAPRVSLQQDRRPSAPSARLRVSLARLQAGKVPRARPREGEDRCYRRLCGKEPGARSPPAPRRPPPRVGTRVFQAACHFRQLGGGGGSVRGLCGQADTLRASGRPLRAELSWEFAQGRLCTPGSFPEDAEHSAGARCVAARVPGALARSGKKRAVFAFANKREPELFPSGEAGCAAPCLPFPPPRRWAAARRPRAPGRLLRARSGQPRPGGPGPRGAGRCRRGCSRARRLQSPSLQLGSCRTREQQVAEDTESSAPTCGAPDPGGRSAGATVSLPGRLSAWAVPFVYTLEDTQLRKHRRRHAVGNGEIWGC